MTSYRPDPAILSLGSDFYDPVGPADFPKCIQRFVNRRWAERVGLELSERDWARHFCRFEPLPDNLPQPLALRYHGHQFRVYNPEIGDGRGFTFAQLRERPGWRAGGRLLDLGTKGSGQTPYSRHADGRLTLKGGVREVLATEMLEALGVNTSKSFALFETGEALERGDEPSPTRSAVLTRLGHGHIRIGAFQRLAFLGEADNLKTLTRYCLENLYGEAGDDPLRLFDLVSDATATLAASYLAAGFVHGVLNSDNINITGESFDYGPWRFTPQWDPDFTAAYFDHYGLYSFGRQAEAIHWNLAQFAGSLSLIAEASALSELLAGWSDRFDEALVAAMLRRLGITRSDDDRVIVGALINGLASRTQPIDQIFFDWRGGHDPGPDAYPGQPFRELARLLRGHESPRTHDYWSGPGPCSMDIDDVEAIWSAIAERDDWQPFNDKVRAVRGMGEAMEQDAPGS
jgi:uncharacterized protein YdiU (UPF0061 family)